MRYLSESTSLVRAIDLHSSIYMVIRLISAVPYIYISLASLDISTRWINVHWDVRLIITHTMGVWPSQDRAAVS